MVSFNDNSIKIYLSTFYLIKQQIQVYGRNMIMHRINKTQSQRNHDIIVNVLISKSGVKEQAMHYCT